MLSANAVFGVGGLPLLARDTVFYEATGPASTEALKIVFVISGWVEVSTTQMAVQLSQGSILTVPPGLECGAVPTGLTRTITLFAEPDFVADQIRWVRRPHPLVHHIQRALQDDSRLQHLQLSASATRALAPKLVRLAQLPLSAEHHFARVSIASDLFAATAHLPTAIHLTPAPIRPRTEVLMAISLMQRTPEHRWRVEELARSVALSRAQLSRLFRDQVGAPPAAYLSQLRASRMAELLATTNMSIAEAAKQAGWERPEIAARSFRKQFGMSPSNYAAFARTCQQTIESRPRVPSRPRSVPYRP